MRSGTDVLKGFWTLTWVETKVFVREPMGFVATIGMPVILFLVLGRVLGGSPMKVAPAGAVPFNLAILAALFISLGSVQSLIAIIAIYREGGILKRLRATPLSPVTILSAQVAVKLAFALVSLGLVMLAGKRVFPGIMHVNLISFAAALLLSTLSILSLGFVLASIVPTARFAQPISTGVLYPMLAFSGLFFPVDRLPRALQIFAWGLPTTHAVALMQGIWDGSGWGAHWMNAVALILIGAVFLGLSTKLFRWE
jgi:ABC-2 type transport system permease protein